MIGVVYRGPREVRVEELAQPRITHPRDAVVRVTRAGVCGTDLHPYRGEIPGFAAGTVLGHEFAGTVHECGPESALRVGQRVFASDLSACGRCAKCMRGWHYQCASASLFGYSTVVGEYLPGGQAEYVRVPFADVVLAPTPDELSDEQALFVGDVLTTGYAAVHGAVTPGDTVAVVGAGPVGLLAATCAATAGAAHVVIADPAPERRERAESFGFPAAAPADLEAAVRELNQGCRADTVIEAVGTDAALRCALSVAGPHATVSVVGAHHSGRAPFPSGLAFARELTVRFVVGDPIRLREPVVALIRAGRVDPSRIVSHRIPLDQAEQAYRMFDSRQAFKAVLVAG